MSEDWVPPGYVSSDALVRERGANEVRNDLFRGHLTAYEWNAKAYDERNGTLPELTPIEPMLWCSGDADVWLTTGTKSDWRRGSENPCRIIVRVEEAKPQPPATGEYLSPYIELMLEASRLFSISAEHWPGKKQLVEHFLKQKLPDGTLISPNLAGQLATFCRPPAAKRGGNTKMKG